MTTFSPHESGPYTFILPRTDSNKLDMFCFDWVLSVSFYSSLFISLLFLTTSICFGAAAAADCWQHPHESQLRETIFSIFQPEPVR